MLNKNYHSKYIMYAAAEEDTVKYLKDHKLKNVINDLITVIKPLEEILLKLYLRKNKLVIQILFSTSLKPLVIESVIDIIKEVTQDYKHVLTIKQCRINKGRLNIIKGFN